VKDSESDSETDQESEEEEEEEKGKQIFLKNNEKMWLTLLYLKRPSQFNLKLEKVSKNF
jgi:hypothetical protein